MRTRVAEYEAHLGEPEDLPPATRRALRGIVGDEMILEIAESAILGGGVPWVVDRRARKLRRVVLDLMQVRDSVHKRAASLGLFTKREAKPLSLQDYLETTYGNGSADGEPAEDPAAAEDPAGTDAEAPGGPEGPSEGESAGERPLGAFPGEAAS